MNKLLLGLLVLSSCSVVAQEKELVGSLTTPVVVGGVIAAGVVTAVVANSDGAAEIITPEKTLKCEGTDPLVNNVCVRTSTSTSVTASGTGTATKTITVPVTTTYAPSLQ